MPCCALCLNDGTLRDSHLLPKAIYRLIRKSSARSPVILTPKLISATDLQVHQDLLCEACEQRFSTGESYALSQCCRGRTFRLQELLESLTPLPGATEPLPFPTVGHDVDIETLVYFSSSLLWRAAAAWWRMWDKPFKLDLGPKYQEEFRRYLLGEAGFPDNAVVWISVTSRKSPELICIGPHCHNKTAYYQYEMQVFGVRWSIFVGGQIVPVVRRMCTLRSPERFIYVSESVEQMSIRGGGNLIKTARITKNVQQ